MLRVALVTNILSPYRVPLYRALASTPGWTLRVFVSAASEFDRQWRVDPRDLDLVHVPGWSARRRIATRGRAASEQVVTAHVPLGLLGALRRFGPDVVISGELGARTLLALLYCAIFRARLVVWSYHSRVSVTSAGPLRTALWRMLLARADAVIGMGRQARQVLTRLGVPRSRLFDAPNAHDAAACSHALANADDAHRRALRERLGCRPRIALVVGRLVPVKGIARLLDAWRCLPARTRADWTLLFVGSGPLETAVREARAAAEPGEIAHLPALQPDELFGLYAAADLLVFPTLSDPWGLVVNEAMACGLPVLCSSFAGCADDLVRPGENGWLFDPTDADGFGAALGEALGHANLADLGRRARATAERFRPESMADGMRAAVCAAAAPR